MSRVTKCICDGCGREIKKEPINIHMVPVDIETGDFITGDEGMLYFWGHQKDYCERCAEQVIWFIERLPGKKQEEAELVATAPEFEKSKSASEKKTGEERQKKPTIKGLLAEGKPDEEILRITGCTKASISQIRYQMKKAQKEEGITEPEKVSEEAPRQTVMCSKVMKTCEFAGKTGGQLTCDYAIIVGHRRGCNPEECTVYRKRKGK